MAVAYNGPTPMHLREGTTDGKVKKVNPDRGGPQDTVTTLNRSFLNSEQYGLIAHPGMGDEQVEPSGQGFVPQNNYPESTGRYG